MAFATEQVDSHISAKVLLDAYLDLFEGCLPPLARVFVPLRAVNDPNRKAPPDLDGHSARELFEQLAKGKTWSRVLIPFNPFYRNGIAHRSTSISPDGSVVVSDTDDASNTRHLSWPHLVALVQDAISVVDAFIGALEVTRLRPAPSPSIESVDGRELIGFYLLPLGQVVDELENGAGGMLTLRIRGKRCDEMDLLSNIVKSLKRVHPESTALFVEYRNKQGEPRGHWSIGPSLLSVAKESVEGLKAAVRDSKRLL